MPYAAMTATESGENGGDCVVERIATLTGKGRALLRSRGGRAVVRTHEDFHDWLNDVADWLDEVSPGSGLSAEWTALPMSRLVVGQGYDTSPEGWDAFVEIVASRLRWLAQVTREVTSTPKSREGDDASGPQDQREVINEVQRLISKVRAEMALLAENPPVRERQVAADAAVSAFRAYFNANRHWLPANVCEVLQELGVLFHRIYVQFTHERGEGLADSVTRGYDSLNEEATPLQRRLEDYFRAMLPSGEVKTNSEDERMARDPSVVFVVHGRDERLREAMFSFLRSIGLKPLEWSEAIALTGSGSPFVGQILDTAFSDAQAFVVLLTGDDESRLRQHLHGADEPPYETDLTPQARPNVLFEAGMALARYPERTILVEVGRLRPFSDVAGRHTIRLSNSTASRQDLAQRLRTAGCPVNLDGRDWHKVGDFGGSKEAAPNTREEQAPGLNESWVDASYPNDSGLLRQMSEDGFEIRWEFDSRLRRRTELEDWEIVEHPDDRSTLRLRDRPENQTLICRRVGFRLVLEALAAGNPAQDVVTLIADGRRLTDFSTVSSANETRSVPAVAQGSVEVNLRFTAGKLANPCRVRLVTGEEKLAYVKGLP